MNGHDFAARKASLASNKQISPRLIIDKMSKDLKILNYCCRNENTVSIFFNPFSMKYG